jgi:DNA-directed RNA polymerase subunit beta'
MNMVVAAPDCGTSRGIALPVGSSDVHDRVLATDFKAKGLEVPKGTVLTPQVVGQMRVADKNANVVVRSTLKCEHNKGVCQKCAGLSPDGAYFAMGDNVGVLAAQSLGERSVQTAMKAFHTGGVRGAGGLGVLNQFDRIEQLTKLPQTIPDSATVAMRGGVVDKVETDATGVKVWVGGKAHHVGKDRLGRPLNQYLAGHTKVPGYKPWSVPKAGMRVEAGQVLSDPNRTTVNPHDLYRATNNMEQVQSFLTDELHDIFREQKVRRQHVETMVRAMGQLSRVQDTGDAEGVIKGDFQNAAKLREINKALVAAGKQPVRHSPVLKGVNILPEAMQEDWMAKLMHGNIKRSLEEAAAVGAISDLHGLHPVPGMAYGAEFGLSDKHSLQPGMGRLKDVPGHHY